MNSIHSNHAIMNSQRISLLVTSYIVLILSITSLVPVEGIEVGELLADHGCSVRWGFVDSLKANVNCSEVAAVNNVCARDLQVVYEEHMPYVFYSSQTSQVEGILPVILNKFIDTCCLGCTRLEYNKIDDIKNTIIQKNTNSTLYDLYMPIKNSPSATTFMTYSYVEILRLENSIFYTKPFSPQPDRLIHILVKGTFKTWPLFGTAIVMAICAGTLIWLMDTWFNKKEFPRSFPRGIFEGFWWAYVSMTTVGYGDKTPRSAVGRIFAVIWILIGIALFNMYTATLTSMMTTTLQRQHTDGGRKIGILENTTISPEILSRDGHTEEFTNIVDLINAFINDSVNAIAMESVMAMYYEHTLKSRLSSATVTVISDNVYTGSGIVTGDANISKMVDSFMTANKDLIPAIITKNNTHTEIFIKGKFVRKNEWLTASPFSLKSKAFYVPVCIGVGVALLCIFFGLCLHRILKNRKNKKKKKQDEESVTLRNGDDKL